MSTAVRITCTRCGTMDNGRWLPAPRRIENPPGWLHINEQWDLCDTCLGDFRIWLGFDRFDLHTVPVAP